MSVAISFDPGAVDDSVLSAHAMDVVMRLPYVQVARAGRPTGQQREPEWRRHR